MTKRLLAERQYTDEAMPRDGDAAGALMPYANKVGGTLFELAQTRDKMNMNSMLADANTEMAGFTADWQKKHRDNPSDPMAVQELKTGYDDIFNKHGEKVSITSRGDWNGLKSRLTNDYYQSNMRWGAAQSIKNAEASVNTGIEKTNDAAYQMGASGTDLGLVKATYANQAAIFKSSLTPFMSTQQIDEHLSNFKSDYMKNHVLGVISRDPDAAKELLSNPDVQNQIEAKKRTRF